MIPAWSANSGLPAVLRPKESQHIHEAAVLTKKHHRGWCCDERGEGSGVWTSLLADCGEPTVPFGHSADEYLSLLGLLLPAVPRGYFYHPGKQTKSSAISVGPGMNSL